ncbi:cysteine hydrolase family protein [Bacteroidota bacterium]
MKTTSILIISLLFLSISVKATYAQIKNNPLSNKIVIVVHIQEDFGEDQLTKESTADAIIKINQVIEEAEPENVIYARSIHKILNLTLKKIYVDKIDLELDDRLKIVNQNTFSDNNGNVFTSGGLIEYIKGKNINEVVIIGRVAEGCITKTILGGKKLGYEMYIISDAIIGKSEKSKAKALNKLKEKGVKELTYSSKF